MKTVRIQVRSLDVWGHAPTECERFDTSTDEGAQECWDRCGGYTVNDVFTCGTIEVPAGAGDNDILQALIDADYLKKGVLLADWPGDTRGGVNVTFEWHDDMCEINDSEDGCPLLQLEVES